MNCYRKASLFSTTSVVIATCIYASQSFASSTDACAGQNQSDVLFTVTSVSIDTQPIFDETAADAIVLHTWANALHINTKPSVVAERLPFDEGDEVTQADIVEAEALLRAERYIANADIKAEFDCASKNVNIRVTTFDNWSLIPTLSFSRSGGENSTIVGVREDNLLGLGIRSTFRYRKDEQRTGYQFSMRSAFPWVRHSNVAITIADNDDGEAYGVAFDKPFYHLASEYSALVSAFTNKRIEDIFQNGDTRNSLSIDELNLRAAYGIQLSASNEETQRVRFGVNRERLEFISAPDSPSQGIEFFENPAFINEMLQNNSHTNFVPETRDFLYPWLGYEFVQRDIQVMQDIYLIRQPEDINLGWELYMQLGIELNNDSGDVGTHTQFGLRKGSLIGEGLLLLSANFESILNTDIEDYARFNGQAEYFYRLSPLIGYYAQASATIAKNPFADRPIVIDDDNGVRGYPLQYQHGNKRFSASLETRFYTDYSFYQLFELGFAAFVDVGRAYDGDFSNLNEDQSLLASTGFGARLYSNKASNPGVVHIDIAKPLGDGESVNTWEWSIQLRRGF
jgi:outer membrane protein assembly factor BamA